MIIEVRLDQYIADTHNISRNRASMLIKDGSISVWDVVITRPSFSVDDGDAVVLGSHDISGYVSRSALKLKYFIEDHPDLSIAGKVCLDVGASTGGFTQILLEYGAKQVIALDVGRDQIDPQIRDDVRVVSLEGMDIRHFSEELSRIQDEKLQMITVDVSFISLTKIVEDLIHIARDGGTKDGVDLILLWKPQFEVGRSHLTKKWVVKTDVISSRFLQEFLWVLTEKDIDVVLHEPSRLHGEEGNVEEVIWVRL